MRTIPHHSVLPMAQAAGRLTELARPWVILPWLSLSMGFTAWMVTVFPQAVDLLQYDRSAVASGEWWRLFTGHWTHWNGEHFLWDVIVFVSLGALCERFSKKAFLACLAAGSLLISIAVWSALPRMQYYRGLSGLDAALYLMVVVIFIRERKMPGFQRETIYASLLLAAFCGKVGYEFATGNAIFVKNAEAFVPVPEAHMAGAAVGAAVALLWGRRIGCHSRSVSGRQRNRKQQRRRHCC